MCGICGIAAFDREEKISLELLEKMTELISHRGPDDSGYYLRNNVALGHRRLSIIDLSGGRQPIANEDGSIWIVFNGEIFNHKLLREELERKGHIFQTNSDTEAIVHAYEEYGTDCPKKLRGMFAFAIWDEPKRRLLLSRDRLGKKPLYYYHNSKRLIFASEIKSLLCHPDVNAELNFNSLDQYLSLRYVPVPRTMFNNIFKLQPGHTLILDENGIRIEKYWELVFRERAPKRLEEEIEEFRELLKECVEMRLMSEVPLGVFLSGGLDSSSIVALMSELGVQKIKTFSIGYEDDDEVSELEYARLAANHFSTEHCEFRLKADEFGDFLPDLVWYMDEPVADAACIPLYFIAKLARKHVTVVLSGEGADELLAGYGIYQRMLILETIHKYYGPLAAIAQPIFLKFVHSIKVRKYLLLAALPMPDRYRGVSNALSDDLKQELWLTHRADADNIAHVYGDYFTAARDAGLLNQMLLGDTKVWLPDDLLVKADKMTMANSLELRTPFLDHKLMEYAAGLPTSLKIRRGSGKFLLKSAMAGLLPAEIINRAKRGFPAPVKRWLNGELSAQTRETLLSPDARVRRYFNINKIKALLDEHESRRADRQEELFTLLVFEHWHRRFLNN